MKKNRDAYIVPERKPNLLGGFQTGVILVQLVSNIYSSKRVIFYDNLAILANFGNSSAVTFTCPTKQNRYAAN